MKQLHVITDLQFGSTGKGLFAGYLARRHGVDAIVTAWGPNAGHTYIERPGSEKMVNIALPNGIVAPSVKRVFIGPGSVVNPDLLLSEMQRYAYWLDGVDVVIHENAAVVQERHREQEAAGMVGIGSTMKGVGAAMIEKIRRHAADQITAGRVLMNTPLEGFIVDSWTYQKLLDEHDKVLVEGAQGYSLSINHGFYPYTTSRDCTTLQILSDCGIPLMRESCELMVYGVARTFPIRVANRYKDVDDGQGGTVKVQVGWSGPCYSDQEEIEWSALGLEPELTTVTRLPRRIFTFSMQQIEQAVRQNGVDAIFLNFCNYFDKANIPGGADELADRIERRLKVPVVWRGWGPTEQDIQEVEA